MSYRRGRAWTASDDERLKQSPQASDEEMAKLMGRSVLAIRARRYLLGADRPNVRFDRAEMEIPTQAEIAERAAICRARRNRIGEQEPMRWTTEKPKQAGWYWYRVDANGYAKPKRIRKDFDTGRLYIVHGEFDPNLDYYDKGGEWSDCPIPLPEAMNSYAD